MPTVPNTYTQTDPLVIRDRALRGFSRAAEARAIREDLAEYAHNLRMRRRPFWNLCDLATGIDSITEMDARIRPVVNTPAERRARARDCTRRALHLHYAGGNLDRIAFSETEPGSRFCPILAAADAAYEASSYQTHREMDHKATAERMAHHDLIGRPAA